MLVTHIKWVNEVSLQWCNFYTSGQIPCAGPQEEVACAISIHVLIYTGSVLSTICPAVAVDPKGGIEATQNLGEFQIAPLLLLPLTQCLAHPRTSLVGADQKSRCLALAEAFLCWGHAPDGGLRGTYSPLHLFAKSLPYFPSHSCQRKSICPL